MNTLIGFLLNVRAGCLVGRLLTDEEGFTPDSASSGQAERVGQVGAYVSIREGEGNRRLLALIQRIEAGQNARSAAGAIVTLIPLGEIEIGEGFRRGVRQYPTPGAELHVVSRDELIAIFARNQPYDFAVGALRNYPDVAVYLEPNTLCGRHFAILGQSGSGKSWTVARLVQQMLACMPNAHIVVLDLHGEYCWKDAEGKLQSAFGVEATRHFEARRLEIPYWLMTFAELVDLLIDRNDAGASIQTAFLRETLLALKTQTAKELGLNVVSLDSPIYFSLQTVYQRFKDANEARSDFGKTKGALFGQFDTFLIKLLSRMNDVRYDFVMNPRRRTHSDSLGDLLQDFTGQGETKAAVTVIDLSSVPFDVRPTVCAQIGRLAFELNYWNPRNREFPILLVCEEAHSYIPREQGTQYDGARKSMERIAKEGRKYGVSLALVSQRPNELSETVLSQCGSFICLRLSNPDDQSYVRQLVPEGDLVDALTSMGRGEAMILGEAIPLPTRCQFSPPEPAPNSADADFFRAWTATESGLAVGAIVDRWRRQGVTRPNIV